MQLHVYDGFPWRLGRAERKVPLSAFATVKTTAKNPADLEMFDSFVFGSKLITEDNYMMTLQIRTHSADEAAPAYYGVQVVDLTAADPKAEMVGDVRTYASENYTSVPVDLSKYIGKGK